ncbi:hypothetical protein H6F42_00085 [Pseudanabaena sp. FACHB-1998]|uniref:hypothetical protein n=1 Tax=Pseudanabaena sp. FACHB-1998 TaxID=2692858 RepID=UPI0016802243|nr:hypothetical protein [Pseudanabaena sp. FACHB-1998]MBD2175313.1 hypothetical protein [Pseudanabaena sp. FACHB-1998]
MPTYAQVEQALINLEYDIDFSDRYPTKLTGYIAIEGYLSQIVLKFRESYHGELGDLEEMFQVEWLMNDGESCLYLDIASLDEPDEVPDIFVKEKVILRSVFDRVLQEIAQLSDQSS